MFMLETTKCPRVLDLGTIILCLMFRLSEKLLSQSCGCHRSSFYGCVSDLAGWLLLTAVAGFCEL